MSSSLFATSAMEAPMSSSLGAMGPLLRKLHSLLAPDYRLPKPLKHGIELLKEDLEKLSADLLEQSMADIPNHKTIYWMDEVRELSYEVEDFIDDMMLRHTGDGIKTRSSRSHRVCRVKVSRLFKSLKPSTRISKIAEFRTLVLEASERRERYHLDACASSSSHGFTGHNRVRGLYGQAMDFLVGFDDLKIKFTKWLTEDADQQLKVACIDGPAGVGKTTLAKQLYYELGGQFDCLAFVRASRKSDTKRLLGDILSQVQCCRLPSYSCEVQNLIDNLMKYLQDKRYFIVIDDLWETKTWDIVKSAFPDGNNYSRIITTAETDSVALECCGYQSDNILNMKPLGSHASAELFFSIVFGSEHRCPDQLREVSYGIIRKCGGLPLATICISGLLASQTDNSELWHHLQKCLCSNLSSSPTLEEMLKEVLNLSYSNLPHYLKTCLLYLTMYPEGCTMWKVDLLKQWISEGFITAKEEKEVEEIADSYFSELVNRGMIQPEQINHNDEVYSCTMHHTVRDLIMYKSKEENFITSMDYSKAITGNCNMIRRLSLHFSSAKYATKPSGVILSQSRSLFFFGLLRCLPSDVEFKLLRVLTLEFWGNQYGHTSLNLTRICSLVHLRYLKISCDMIVELPAQMQGLRYMETLEINARISSVPLDIIDLPGLLHLSLRDETNLPDGIGRIRSLRTLQYFDLGNNTEDNVLSLGGLMNLQYLHLTYSTVQSDEHLKRNMVALASSVIKLVNLKSVILAPGALSTAIYHDVLSSVCSPPVFLQGLQRLDLLPPICMFSRVPKDIGVVCKLCYLSLVVCELRRNDIDSITGLPALTVLSLYVRQPPAESIIFNNGSFPALKYFKYMCGVLCLAFQEGALPNVHKLKLGFNARKGQQHDVLIAGIQHLVNLKKIDGIIGAAVGAEEPDRSAAESAFKDTIRKHQRFPNYVNVKRVDWIEEENESRTQVNSSSSEWHEILQKECGVNETEEDTKQFADSGVTSQIMQVFPQHKDLCLDDTKLTMPSNIRKAFPEKLEDNIAAEAVSFSSTTSSVQSPQSWSAPSSHQSLPETYTWDPEGSPWSRALRSPSLTPRNTSAPQSAMNPMLSPEDHISPTEGTWSTAYFHPLPLPPSAISQMKTTLSNQPAPKVEMSLAGQWQKRKLIGSGTFGCVYEATNRHTGAVCAVKEINIIPNDSRSTESLKQLDQEIKLLSQFKHENIVQYYGSETIKDQLYVYMEYVYPGSINKYIKQHCGAITESIVCNFTRHILRGLAFLHGQNIMHRDIKGENMLIDVNGVVKLADIGMAKHLCTVLPNLSLKGTPYWMAPEMVRASLVKDMGYDLAVDIWSLGCTIIEMFNGKPPWSGLEGPAAMFKVLNKDPPLPDNLSHEAKDFLECCFKRDLAVRPSASQLLNHPFIRNSSHYSKHVKEVIITGCEEAIQASCDTSLTGKTATGGANDARSSESLASQLTLQPVQVAKCQARGGLPCFSVSEETWLVDGASDG
ncbi:disease resistance protein RGA5-like isoform X3 [Hordeum vulgare subsp. vulgare]|uniref:mitogen-activated protein kinase kinase kinase n=1 Tax=Hordeum vulgare subsp. vulgare TaxID=112509 RepID=A0A8I6XA75_HORVV|nr:disease resistance protein RGA5-like isoform X3 [Hordeum vulgare subsp. vulgare]